MQALCDSQAGAISLDLEEPAGQAVHGEDCAGLVDALAEDGRVVGVEALEAERVEEALAVAAGKFDLDLGLLGAAAGAALAAPDREIVKQVVSQARSADGEGEPSGKILMRVPSSLHGKLLEEAEREGVSLNQFCAAALAAAVSWRIPESASERPRRPARITVPRGRLPR